MSSVLKYYYTEDLEEYVENFLNEQTPDGKGYDKIKMKWSDIDNMLEEYLYEIIDNVDPYDISRYCIDELVEYIKSKRSDIEFEND